MPEPDLYGLSPGAFIAARDVLAKQRKAEGNTAEAARVRKLRRPSLTAWALNQVARQHPHLVTAVLESSSSLRNAMERALAGDASAVRGAQDAERRAVDAAVNAASAALEAAGHAATDTARQKMRSTLRAAGIDDSVAATLAAGTLDQDRDAPGFGLAAVDVPLQARPDRERVEAEAHRAELLAQADRLRQLAHRLVAQADEAEQRATEARARADQAVEEADQAQERVEGL